MVSVVSRVLSRVPRRGPAALCCWRRASRGLVPAAARLVVWFLFLFLFLIWLCAEQVRYASSLGRGPAALCCWRRASRGRVPAALRRPGCCRHCCLVLVLVVRRAGEVRVLARHVARPSTALGSARRSNRSDRPGAERALSGAPPPDSAARGPAANRAPVPSADLRVRGVTRALPLHLRAARAGMLNLGIGFSVLHREGYEEGGGGTGKRAHGGAHQSEQFTRTCRPFRLSLSLAILTLMPRNVTFTMLLWRLRN